MPIQSKGLSTPQGVHSDLMDYRVLIQVSVFFHRFLVEEGEEKLIY